MNYLYIFLCVISLCFSELHGMKRATDPEPEKPNKRLKIAENFGHESRESQR